MLWALDAHSTLLVTAFVIFLLGGMLLFSALAGRRDHTLGGAAVAMLLAGAGGWLLMLRFDARWPFGLMWLSNCLLIGMHGSLWTSIRVYFNRPVSWGGLLAGAAVWTALSFWDVFVGDLHLRIVAYSVVVLVYVGLTCRELWGRREEAALPSWVLLVILGAHALYLSFRTFQIPVPEVIWYLWPDFTLTLFEMLWFCISISFGVLMLVQARLQNEYRHAALHDALTGMPNRRALFEQGARVLSQTRRDGRDAALLMCDLDWFKRLNDAHGHEAGDQALVYFARTLQATLRGGDLCARLGGEEFVVMAQSLGPLGAAQLAERIRRAVSVQAIPPYEDLTVSIGIASASEAGYDLDGLLSRADRALYAAKGAGRDCVRPWTPGMD